MSNDEFEFILAALEFVATYGQRFLTFYDFNLRTGSWTARKKALLCLVKKNNCNVHVLPLANHLKEMKMESEVEFKKCSNEESKHDGILVNKFALYLETALDIAHSLPKFPPQRRLLEEELDLNFLHFRV